MELVTVFVIDAGSEVKSDRFKIGANVRPANSEEIALNNFAVKTGDIRVSTGVSSLSSTIQSSDRLRLFTGEEFKIQLIDDSERGKRNIFARGT